MFKSEPEGQGEGGEELGEQPERPAAFKPKVKAILKPKQTEDEVLDEVYSLKERIDRLEAQRTQGWREVGQKESKPAGTLLDGELSDRMNKTIADYEKSGVKLYKRKLFEEGLEEQLDVLNSTAELDDAFEKACKNVGWGKEAPDIKKFVEHIEGIEDYVWTSERAKYALNLLRGRPEKIEEFLKAEPEVRGFVDYQSIEKAKRAAKAKIKVKGGDGDDGTIFGWMFDQGEPEEPSEGEEKGEEEEEPFLF